jgi:hypothetical protein
LVGTDAASAPQISDRLSFEIASWTCLPPASPVMTIQSRYTNRDDGAWLSEMQHSRPLNAYSLSALGAEKIKPSVPTISRLGPCSETHA